MNCQKCGAPIPNGVKFCTNCGYNTAEKAQQSRPVQYIPQAAPSVEYRYIIPEENKPISPWIIALLTMLYAIPLVGFISCIVFSFNSNINIRNHARSLWCAAIISILLLLALTVIGAATGTLDRMMDLLENLGIIEY